MKTAQRYRRSLLLNRNMNCWMAGPCLTPREKSGVTPCVSFRERTAARGRVTDPRDANGRCRVITEPSWVFAVRLGG